jgi:hypothetical protein
VECKCVECAKHEHLIHIKCEQVAREYAEHEQAVLQHTERKYLQKQPLSLSTQMQENSLLAPSGADLEHTLAQMGLQPEIIVSCLYLFYFNFFDLLKTNNGNT